MRKNLGLLFIYGLASVCFVIFVITKIDTVLNKIAIRNYQHGNLFDFCKVSYFKIKIPEAIDVYKNSKNLKVDDINLAEIITIGDSYFGELYGHDQFPFLLAEKLNKKVFHASYLGLYDKIPDIKTLLDTSKYNTPKILLLESTEQYINLRFGNQGFQYYNLKDGDPVSDLKKMYGNLFVNSEKRYTYLYDNSLFFKKIGLQESLANLRFKYAGIISASIGKFSTKDSMLFYSEGVDHFYKPYQDLELDDITSNIKKFKEELWKNYKIKLIFLPIPDKYRCYHTLINNDKGNQFFERLIVKLEQKNIPYIDLLKAYHNQKELMYWKTDTHWNLSGVHIGVNLVSEYINSNP